MNVDSRPKTPLANIDGQFYYGNEHGFSCYLSLDSGGTFRNECSSCFDVVFSVSGLYFIEADFLYLKSNSRNDPQGKFLDEYFILCWGERAYLIPRNYIIDFCNAINHGFEPRSSQFGNFYLMAGDESKPVDRIPVLPEPWNGYILKQAIDGIIVSMDDLYVVVNLGAEHGVKSGMVMAIMGKKGRTKARIEIVDVNEHYSRCKIILALSDIKLGDMVTSRITEVSTLLYDK